ncbi:TPA: hypothetical protein RSW61_005306 [Vibrio harveyi]|nr:hypothetical protein [Vibrio harveyi]
MIIYYKPDGSIVSVQSEPVTVFSAYQSVDIELSENELNNIATYKIVNGALVQSTELIEQKQQEQAEKAELEAEISKKNNVRSEIAQTAGDTLSLLGTTSDAALLLMFEVAKMAKGINSAASLDDVKEAAKPISDLLSPLLIKIDSGEVKFPHLEKGVDVVMADIEKRSTSVSNALIDNK